VSAECTERMNERWIRFPVRTVLSVLGLIIAVWALLHLVSIARDVLIWLFVAIFLAMAINPLVDLLNRRGFRRRGAAVALAVVLVLIAVAGIGALFIPTLVDQVTHFVDAVPGYLHDITKGKGRFGFLETKYHVVEKTREYINKNGAGNIFGLTGAALSITKSVLNIVLATVTISVLTIFLLLEGPAWMERIYSLLPAESQPRWRQVGHDVYRTVGGYVNGNLLISLIAGTAATLVLLALGVPYSVALGLLVAIFDLIPLAGATIAAILVSAVAFTHSILAGAIVVGFFVVYQQVENHLLQPVVYGRTVKLSPLAVLVSVLIGAKVAGVLGALGAIPMAGAIQILIVDFLRFRRERITAAVVAPPD
jgi:predicted PurR-regulated permease PerM